MSDALPLPSRPNLEQYKKLAKDLQHACKSGDRGAILHYRGERMDYEDLVVRPQAVQVAPREPSREPAKHVGSKPAPGHPWRQGYEQRMKLQRLNRSQESALVGVSASATP